jgi:predicted phosphohydrolase
MLKGEIMAIYAIGDLHLSFSSNKPMDIFGDHWTEHASKIKQSWCENVKESDVVLIPGDISWALTLEDAKEDLDFIRTLPGRKIMIRGNHDYWWSTLSKMKSMYDDLDFIQNNYIGLDDYAICGTRGWVSPNDSKFTDHDLKIYTRELHRLKLSLESAVKDGYNQCIVMLHYPPTNDKKEESKIQTLLEEYPVKIVVYGHLHTKHCWHLGLQGEKNGIDYHLVASDYLNFEIKEIKP